MNFSISYNSILKLKEILAEFKPDVGYNDFVKDIKLGIKATKMTSQKNYLEKLRARGECTPEVASLARRRLSTDPRNTRRNKAEEKRIMYFRIRERINKSKEKGRIGRINQENVRSVSSLPEETDTEI